MQTASPASCAQNLILAACSLPACRFLRRDRMAGISGSTAERIRDKIAASKKKGMWMGGMLPLGYDANGRTLTVNDSEAETVRTLYDLYQEHRSIRTVTRIAAEMELRSKHRLARSGRSGRRAGGGPMGRGHIHQILTTLSMLAGFATTRMSMTGNMRRSSRRQSGRKCSKASPGNPAGGAARRTRRIPQRSRESSLTRPATGCRPAIPARMAGGCATTSRIG